MAIDGKTARVLLSDERRRLVDAKASVDRDIDEERLGASDELAAYDQHPAERGTEVHDMSRDLGLDEDLDRLIRENEDAARRLDDGRYGRCERCGKPIADDRLRAVPSTRYCLDDQLAAEAAT